MYSCRLPLGLGEPKPQRFLVDLDAGPVPDIGCDRCPRRAFRSRIGYERFEAATETILDKLVQNTTRHAG